MEISDEKMKKQKAIQDAIQEELIGLHEIGQKSYQPARTLCFRPPELKKDKQKNEECQLINEKDHDLREDGSRRHIITNGFPQSFHGVVIAKESEDSSNVQWGSGVMIGPDIVLTAAQNVYNDEKPIRKKYSCLKFIPAANGFEAPFDEIEVEEIFVPESYINNEESDLNPDDDGSAGDDFTTDNFAVMILRKPIGYETGYFGLQIVTPKKWANYLSSKEIRTVGYRKNELTGNFEQWEEKRKIITFPEEGGLIRYQTNTDFSQTGGGVFYEDDEEDSQFYVIGVHTGGNGSSNMPCWITIDRYKQLRRWIKESRKKKAEAIIQGKGDIKKLNLENKYRGEVGLQVLLEMRLNGLEDVNLTGHLLGEKGIDLLSSNSKWENLRRIDLSFNFFRDKGCHSLGSNTTWKKLERLVLSNNELSEEGVKELVKNTYWIRLIEIDLSDNNIGDKGAVMIASNLTWSNLEILKLSKNKIGDEGGTAISQTAHWNKLKILNLSINKIGDVSGMLLGKNTTWKNLEELDLSCCSVGTATALAIASNTSWDRLKILNLSYTAIGEEGGTAIGMSTLWRNFIGLYLRNSNIGDRTAIAIGSNTNWNRLRFLDLGYNGIGDGGGVAIGKNTTWKRLEKLLLDCNHIGNESANSIGSNITWERLIELLLYVNEIGDKGGVAIARNVSWKKLEKLGLKGNQLGWKSAVAMACSSAWSNIKEIELKYNNLVGERANAFMALRAIRIRYISF